MLSVKSAPKVLHLQGEGLSKFTVQQEENTSQSAGTPSWQHVLVFPSLACITRRVALGVTELEVPAFSKIWMVAIKVALRLNSRTGSWHERLASGLLGHCIPPRY